MQPHAIRVTRSIKVLYDEQEGEIGDESEEIE